MAKKLRDDIYGRILNERQQTHDTRKKIIKKIESLVNMPVVTVFTSFRYPVMFEDYDVDMIENLLLTIDTSKGLAIVLNSPGGDGLAAERAINVFRNHSGTGKYIVLVPGKAKSAATMICFGASEIIMGESSSELGPVDPQIVLSEDGKAKRYSAYNLLNSYKELFKNAEEAKGNLEPFLQQLQHYDERDMAEYQSAISLAEDISCRALKTGMLSSLSDKEIKKNIKVFLTPDKTKVHARPIFADEALDTGLKVKKLGIKDKLWISLHELYLRTNLFTSSMAQKCIETTNDSLSVPAP